MIDRNHNGAIDSDEIEYLVAQVSAGIRSGRPLAELKETITLDRYKGWANYERLRRMNVEAAYLNLTAQ